MNNNNRESLIALLTQTQNVYQDISRKILWSAADTEHLDDLCMQKNCQRRSGAGC